jgi:sec-independent protein translocase protein TatA
MGPIGPLELGIVLLVVLLIFGPKRLPGLGKQLGTGMREFKDGITGKGKDDDDEDDEPRPQITATPAAPTAASAEARAASSREDAPPRA